MTVKDHYDRHLGNFYSWMAGDFNEKVNEHLKIFQNYGIDGRENSTAIDLGCGHGIQSIALAKIGFKVRAVDFNQQLLNELRSNAGNHQIEVAERDILEFLIDSEQVELICCMGDTITHLPEHKLSELFSLASKKLKAGGKVIISFRDLTVELKGDARFIPVKADDGKSLTCFLEYHPEHVVVHDILWEKDAFGWTQKVSSYQKLRLSVDSVTRLLETNGLVIKTSDQINRMNFIVAEKM